VYARGVNRAKPAVFGADTDKPEIGHLLCGVVTCNLGVAKQPKVGPKRAAREEHSVKAKSLVLEHMHVCAFGSLAQLMNELWDRLTLELVIAGHVKNRPIWERSRSPLDALDADVDIARQNDHVGIRFGRVEVLEFDM